MFIKKFESYSQSEIDRILDKINASGIESLTDSEKRYLDGSHNEDDKTSEPSWSSGRSSRANRNLSKPKNNLCDDYFIKIYDIINNGPHEYYIFGLNIVNKKNGVALSHYEFEKEFEVPEFFGICQDFMDNDFTFIEDEGILDLLCEEFDWTLDSLKDYLKDLGFSDIRYDSKLKKSMINNVLRTVSSSDLPNVKSKENNPTGDISYFFCGNYYSDRFRSYIEIIEWWEKESRKSVKDLKNRDRFDTLVKNNNSVALVQAKSKDLDNLLFVVVDEDYDVKKIFDHNSQLVTDIPKKLEKVIFFGLRH